MVQAAGSGFMNATDAADYLVSKGMPFRECDGGLVVVSLPVRHKALQAPNGYGLLRGLQHLAHRAEALALLLLGTDATADRRKEVRLLDGVHRGLKIALLNVRDEVRNVDPHGAALHAGLILA